MTTDAAHPAPHAAAPHASRHKRLKAWIGFALGLALLAAAVYALARNSDTLTDAYASVRASSPWLLALAVVLPILNNLAVSMSFWVQTRRLGPVTAPEMAALIGAAWLLNYLPLRAGMIGRLAYHKHYHNIAIRDSLAVMVLGMLAGGISIAVGFALSLTLAATTPVITGLAILATPIPLALIAHVVARAAVARNQGPAITLPRLASHLHGPTLCLVFALRYLDFLLWIGRYLLVFHLVGSPISFATAAVLAGVCQLALNIALVGNGLGLREWLVALAGAHVPAGLLGTTGRMTTAIGLTADLVNRAAEILAAIPTALVSFAYLAHLRTRRRAKSLNAKNAERAEDNTGQGTATADGTRC